MTERGIHVLGCPYCKIFTDQEFKGKLYYPEESEVEELDDFVIIHCNQCNTPKVIATDHTVDIGKERWGRILKKCRELFGGGVKLKINSRDNIKDHWSAHVCSITKEPNKLPNLRGE